ncbi:MAG: SRPBCC family protein [Candidatus Dormibacteria bacterium]
MSGSPGTRHGTAVVTLPSDVDILIARTFDAPAELVFDAWTTPELVRRWWAGDRGAVIEVQIDLRVGGRWRWVMVTNGGVQVAFNGEYREIDRPRRLVRTEVFELVPDAAGLSTVTFEESQGVTMMRILSGYPSRELRDAAIASGMEGGLQAALDCLEDLLHPAG